MGKVGAGEASVVSVSGRGGRANFDSKASMLPSQCAL
jgi:hypothetical protein